MGGTEAKAAVYGAANEALDIRSFEVCVPAGSDVRLALERSGICGTDVHIAEGRLPLPGPFIPGHEFVGRVEELGPEAGVDGLGRALEVGDLAVACVALACGKCFNCARNEPASCTSFGVTYVRDPEEPPHFFGGFAEMLFSPASALVKLPEGVAVDAAAAFPCAGPTVIRACTYAGGLEPGELVVVQGTGPVGLFAVAWAAIAGCTVVAVGSGRQAERLALARELGATAVFDYRETSAEDLSDEVRRMAAKAGRGDGADVVFEASGSPQALPVGLDLLRTRGRYVVPGQYSNSGPVEIEPQKITFKALRITGSAQYTLSDIRTYLEFLRANEAAQGKLASCITHRYAVEQANEAMADASAGRSIKGVFTA